MGVVCAAGCSNAASVGAVAALAQQPTRRGSAARRVTAGLSSSSSSSSSAQASSSTPTTGPAKVCIRTAAASLVAAVTLSLTALPMDAGASVREEASRVWQGAKGAAIDAAIDVQEAALDVPDMVRDFVTAETGSPSNNLVGDLCWLLSGALSVAAFSMERNKMEEGRSNLDAQLAAAAAVLPAKPQKLELEELVPPALQELPTKLQELPSVVPTVVSALTPLASAAAAAAAAAASAATMAASTTATASSAELATAVAAAEAAARAAQEAAEKCACVHSEMMHLADSAAAAMRQSALTAASDQAESSSPTSHRAAREANGNGVHALASMSGQIANGFAASHVIPGGMELHWSSHWNMLPERVLVFAGEQGSGRGY